MKITKEKILENKLYQAVVKAEKRLRHPIEYDHGTVEERRMALLCFAVQLGCGASHPNTTMIDTLDSLELDR